MVSGRRLWWLSAMALVCLLVPDGLVGAFQGGAGATPAGRAVPADLKPLLAARASEMRLIVTRYEQDRTTLSGNYASGTGRGGRGGGGGRAGGAGAAGGQGSAGGAAAQVPQGPVPLSPNRLARLKRFDLDWQTALGKIDAAKLSPEGKADLDALKTSMAGNLAQLEADALVQAQVMPVVPFAAKMVPMIEARIRVDDINSETAAATLTAVIRDIADLRTALEAGLMGTAGGLQVNKALALRGAEATDNLRTMTAEWFGFYNGYDPLFTWWMGMPYKAVNTAFQDYATFLREKIAAADELVGAMPATVPPVQPAPAPKFSSIPDLAEMLALPQDEMRDIVAQFNAAGGGGGRGGGGAPAGAGRDNVAWLAALTSLDFDALSRNAQVDYLYIKWRASTDLAHQTETIPPGPAFRPDASKIQGKPRGREGLIADLRANMIPYTPEQLIALANKEYAWCEAEMKKASREMGFGDDWKKAVEKVKTTYVPPGGQPRMIMDLLNEAIDYLRVHDLITVPGVAAESLHMTMMSPQDQLTSPFFLGGDHILVSYPTDTMEFDARMQSMRGNNPGFSHATAFHEMIPGHNLVGYLNSRYRAYRPSLTSGGPFYGEGWPLYWELTMYELGFDKTPEQRVGALFWRMHRCARIIFSLNFHMGIWTPLEAVDFLVDKVGHERDNAMAEVRRSFESPQYQNQPLYQAAYLLGGLQLRGLRKELVDGRLMTNRQFHDEIMRQGNMPMALIRLAVTKMKLTKDMDINWKFYGDLPEK